MRTFDAVNDRTGLYQPGPPDMYHLGLPDVYQTLESSSVASQPEVAA